MSRIVTLVPTRGIVYTQHEVALERELYDAGQVPFIIRTVDKPLPESRNFLVDEALKLTWWDYALLVDDDIVMPEGSLKKLLELDTDIAVIDYPHHTIGMKDGEEQMYGVAVYDDWAPGDSVEGKRVAYAGLGCVLVRREVLEKMEKPAFRQTHFQYRREGKKIMFTPKGGTLSGVEQAGSGGGEDTYFYLTAHKEGFTTKVVPGMVASHLRLSKIIQRMQEGRYTRTHTVGVNDRIDTPLQ